MMAEWHRTMDFCVVHRAEYLGGAGCEVWVATKEGGGYPTPCEIERGKWTAVGEPVEGEQVKWLTRSGWTCPYDRDLCGADATLTVTQIDSDQVEGLLECVNGHRWKLARLADLSEEG